ncbi:phosphoglycerate mutase-like protein [Anaeromyces robustus]|uniref:Phosphoglycerate mutase-like protein n=1 Tax=Anaeromyces robustus TaxID=1754192 RepID=A0A1Y1WYI5_9FUNG|nr:phosphoglycerate mutase-like protein [Anaeromyces robustus]|eukprot:ORX78455.1 phosphoglycerate mutase-like protein [Anaeromyces robustus]
MKFLYLVLLLPFVVSTQPQQFISLNDVSKFPTYDSSKLKYCQAGKPSVNNYKEIEGYTLQSVQIVTRHGDRTPLTLVNDNEENVWQCKAPKEYVSINEPYGALTYLKFIDTAANPDYSNPFIRKSFWKGTCFPGQLTQRGSEQHVELGKALKEIYVDKLKFIDEKSLSDLYVRSTNVLRTQLSVQSLLSGFMPNRTEAIPIHTLPHEIETTFPNQNACPVLKKLNQKIKNEENWKNYIKKNTELKKKLDTYMSYPLNDDNYGFQKYVDVFLARACHNMKLPCVEENCKYTTEMLQQINDNADFEYGYIFSKAEHSKKYLTVGIGYFLREIINNMGSTVGSKHDRDLSKTPSFYIFSAHDNSVAPIMGALGVEPMEWPPYASNLIFELWKDNDSNIDSVNFNDYVVRVIYNGEVIKTNWCDFNQCPLSSLYYKFKEYFPSIDACFEYIN